MERMEGPTLDVLGSLALSGWGIGSIENCPYTAARGFNRALSLLESYDYDLEGYDEQTFHQLLLDKQRAADAAVLELCLVLDKLGIPHLPVPHTQDRQGLEAVFSHKYAATRAGLGWIGKCTLLVTPEWGPRVFLRTVLVDARLNAAEPVENSRCGDCRACVDACPYACINGRDWEPGMNRDELLDVFTCNQVRLDAIPELGHKDACGFCLLACPSGR